MTAECNSEPRAPLLLMQFAKVPRPGQVKTRMIPPLSAADACALHVELMQWTCRTLCSSALGDTELWLSQPGDHVAINACMSYGLQAVRRQQGADLGERMYHALADGLSRYRKVVLVGSDCPGIDREYLLSASQALDSCDLVVGPARDGGYVLIGARRVEAALFQGIRWGGAEVYAHTVERLESRNFAWQALALQSDIDRPEDLPLWQDLKRG